MTQTPANAAPTALPSVVGDEELLDVAGVQAYLGVSRWWIDKYSTRKDDPLPWIGTKRMRRMRKSALLAWMERNAGTAE